MGKVCICRRRKETPRLNQKPDQRRPALFSSFFKGIILSNMKPLFGALVVFSFFCAVGGNLIQFADMVRRATGRLPSLFYNGYGCYCGLGGSKQPLDPTDWCCQAHDCCYGRASELSCNPKMEMYSYSFQGGTIVCGGVTLCQRLACECDKAASLCFRAAPFRTRNIYFPNFLCRGKTPPC
ncbi:group IIE secretory phospholipase A2-like [Anolis carolinensis]|uniref:group IIE secretory phospholipase A2-like n=1 Tax=Anolis carolinensis TaxID=28377 RepID=UPI002F2B5C6D